MADSGGEQSDDATLSVPGGRRAVFNDSATSDLESSPAADRLHDGPSEHCELDANGTDAEATVDGKPNDVGAGSSKFITEQLSVDAAPAVQDPVALLKCTSEHVFILSDAGKPIYYSGGDENSIVPLFGVIQALCSFMVEGREDTLHTIRYRRWRCVFLRRSPLILATSSAAGLPVSCLRSRLCALYHQLLTVLTRRQIESIFERRRNFDLRRLLHGTASSMEVRARLANADPAAVFGDGLRCLPLAASVRNALQQAIVQAAAKIKSLVFAVVISRGQLVALVRVRRCTLSPADLHALITLVECNPTFRVTEAWSPLCLPDFDEGFYVHAHISYISDGCDACLLLLTLDRSSAAFHSLSDMRRSVLDRLRKAKVLEQLSAACASGDGAVSLAAVPAINDMWHFVYKNRSSQSVCAALVEAPFATGRERVTLATRYLDIADRCQWYADDTTADCEAHNVRILYEPTDVDVAFAWLTNDFELYTIFRPTTSKHVVVAEVARLLKYLKKEEDRLFILSGVYFSHNTATL